MPIRDLSPHLAGELDRRGLSCPTLDAAFDFAIQHGGLDEVDFVREEGVSYNPRPARIALILLKDVQTDSFLTLAGGMLAAVPAALHLAPRSCTDAAALAHRSALPPTELAGEPAAAIACAVFLDRARHLHQAASDRRRQIGETMLDQCKDYIRLAEHAAPGIAVLLTHWERRVRRASVGRDNPPTTV